MIHVEKVEMRVYCDIKAETIVCTHSCTREEKSSMLCSHPILAISKKILILSFIMFISLKLEQMINFALNVRLKRRAQKERHKKE